MSHNNCVCGDVWRFEATDLATGRVKAVLHPISIDWEDPLSKPGQGSVLLATRAYAPNDIWPHRTGIYVSRVHDDGSRDGLWGGYVESYQGNSGDGGTSLGMMSIDEFLWRRLLVNADGTAGADYSAEQKQQTLIALDLANFALPRGISGLKFAAEASVHLRDVTYNGWDFKNIGEAIDDLTTTLDGVKYRLTHAFHNGYWSTTMTFSDDSTTDRNIILKSDREGSVYGVVVDAKDSADRVFGIGQGEEEDQLVTAAFDEARNLPEFQSTQAWKDIDSQDVLDKQTAGYVADFRDPVATPSMTIAGLSPDPSVLQTGDTVDVEIGYGLVAFSGKARILSQGWSLNADGVTRALTISPKIRPEVSMRNETPVNNQPALDPFPPPLPDTNVTDPPQQPVPIKTPPSAPKPEPKAGLVSYMTDSRLNESSSLAYSVKHSGIVYTSNDEVQTPQIYGVKVSTGRTVTTFSLSGVALPGDGDPETMRIDTLGRLWLGDIGDNTGSRSDIAIYRGAEPDSTGNLGAIGGFTRYPLSYPDGARNAEALAVSPLDPNNALIFSKEQHGHLYRLPHTLSTGGNVLTRLSSSMPAFISDATFTKNGKWILIRQAGVRDTGVLDAHNGRLVDYIPSFSVPKGESITMEPDGRSFLIGSERVPKTSSKPSPIYRIILPKEYR